MSERRLTPEQITEIRALAEAQKRCNSVPTVPGTAPEPGADGLEVITLADVRPVHLSWLWPERLPRGKLVVLDGDPSTGKSTLTVDLAATVTTGGTWPDGTRCEYPGDVLILSAEDDLASTIRPRLDAAGADVHRVHAITGRRLEDGTLMPPTLAEVACLEDVVHRFDARLLVVDVLNAYVPTGVDTHKDSDIRKVLSRLSALAERTGCTVLLLRHLNKGTGTNALYRGGGSIGIIGAARVGLLAAVDPDDDNQRVLAVLKSNLGPVPPALCYRVVGSGGAYDVGRIAWGTESSLTAAQLLGTDDDRDSATEAEMWLADYLLQAGEVESAVAKRDAAKIGIPERTLKYAAKKLNVVYRAKGFPRQTYWSLPDSQAVTPDTLPTGLSGPTGSDQVLHNNGFGPTESQSGHRTTQSGQSGQSFGTGPTGAPLNGYPTDNDDQRPLQAVLDEVVELRSANRPTDD